MQRESDYKAFLMQEKTITSKKAVDSRMARARKAESILGQQLDIIVADDDLMYDSLAILESTAFLLVMVFSCMRNAL